MAEGTPSPDTASTWACVYCAREHAGPPPTEVQCTTCGTFVRSCHPSWGDNVILSLHSAVCAGRMPDNNTDRPVDRYVSGFGPLPLQFVERGRKQ